MRFGTPFHNPFLDLMMGIFGLLTSVVVLVLSLSILWQTKASQQWPVAEGAVLTSEVVSSGEDEDSGRYKAEITYRYRIDGRDFAGDTLYFGMQFGGSRQEAQAITNRYPTGASILVHYNPDRPYESVLEPGSTEGVILPFAFGGLLLVASLVAIPLVHRMNSKQQSRPRLA